MRVEMPEDHGIVEKTLKERDTRSGGWHISLLEIDGSCICVKDSSGITKDPFLKADLHLSLG